MLETLTRLGSIMPQQGRDTLKQRLACPQFDGALAGRVAAGAHQIASILRSSSSCRPDTWRYMASEATMVAPRLTAVTP